MCLRKPGKALVNDAVGFYWQLLLEKVEAYFSITEEEKQAIEQQQQCQILKNVLQHAKEEIYYISVPRA